MQSARFRRSLRCSLSIATAIALTSLAPPATAAGVAPSAATKEQKDSASSRFLRGKELYGQNKFDAALAEFTASLEIVASPNTRLYVARCLREMNKPAQAYAEFGRTASEARELAKSDSRYEKAAEAAEQDQKALEPKVGLVSVSVQRPNASTTLKVGGEDVRREAWTQPIAVNPGNAEVVAETPGRPAARKSVTVAAGQKESVTVDAAAEEAPAQAQAPAKDEKKVEVSTPSDRAGLRPYAYVAGGIALAGLATFTVAGLLSNGTYSDLEQACGGERACAGHDDEISSGKTQQTVANVGFVVFLIGAAGAVTLWVLSAPSKSTASSASTATSSAPTAKVVARSSFLGLEGSF